MSILSSTVTGKAIAKPSSSDIFGLYCKENLCVYVSYFEGGFYYFTKGTFNKYVFKEKSNGDVYFCSKDPYWSRDTGWVDLYTEKQLVKNVQELKELFDRHIRYQL